LPRRIAALGAAALTVFGISAGAASAATLSGSNFSINFDGVAGEVHTLTIDRTATAFRFTDAAGITITTPGGSNTCTAAGNVGTCPIAEVNDIRAIVEEQNDTITVSQSVGPVGFILVAGGNGNDVLNSQAPSDTQMNGDPDFLATPGNDTLIGGPGEETMIGGPGNDTMTGGPGNDRLIIEEGNDVLNAGPGDDLMDGGFAGGSDGPDILVGGEGRDRVDLRSRSDDLFVDIDGVADDGANCPGAGCEGDNVAPDVEDVSTGQGDDTLTGSAGPDRLNTEDGDDLTQGLGGADSMQSSEGADVLRGGAGGDSMFGGSGPDQFFGGAGDDAFNYEFFDDDTDVYRGGAGFDGITGAEEDDTPIRVSLNGQADDGFRSALFSNAKDNVGVDVEDVTGSEGSDLLIGSKRPNHLIGFDGRDRLLGLAGEDALIGARGRDSLVGAKGRDLLDGGGGPDRLNSRDGRPDEVRCGSSIDRLKADRADRFGPDCDKVSVRGRR
jgi:Ca2+-binding RTX toxin-like protein